MKKNGFTLVELLIAIAVISILASLLTPTLLNARSQAVQASAFAYARSCTAAVTAYALDNPGLDIAGVTCYGSEINSGALPEYVIEAKLNNTSNAIDYKFLLNGTEQSDSIPIFLN